MSNISPAAVWGRQNKSGIWS